MNKIIYFIAAFLVTAFLISCSDDDPVGPGPVDLGSISFSVSGEIEEDLDGFGEFFLETEGSLPTWDFSFSNNPQTYSLIFLAIGDENSERPETGTYTIGPNVNDGDFFASFGDLSEGIQQEVEYTTQFENTGGELVITESTSDVIRETFSFTAAAADPETGEPTQQITINGGEFEAVVVDDLFKL